MIIWQHLFRAVWFAPALLSMGCGCTQSASVRNGTSPSEPAEGSPAVSAEDTVRFTDVTKESGIQWVYQNGREAEVKAILESLGGGVAMIDFDADGRLDLCFAGGGRYEGKNVLGLPSAMFRNLGDWKFADVSAETGEGWRAKHYTHGCFAADYDNDGFTDLVITGYGGFQLWHNLGDGCFVESADAAALHDELWSSAAGFGDVNGDGLLDLYVVHYVNWSFQNHPRCNGVHPGTVDICPPKEFAPLPDTLFINNGDGTFHDGSQAAGLRSDGKGLAVILADVDLDGDLDIYVANDTTNNFLYLNDGHGVFQEVGEPSGVATDERGTPNGSMGVDVGDYNLDGRPDIWVANFEVESFALYRNDGHGLFLHVSQPTGVTALNGLFVGFGTAFVDLDRDGDEDIVVTNGHVILYPRSAPLLQLPLLLINEKGKMFRRMRIPDHPYLDQPHAGRGLAVGDLDNDGDADMVFANNHEPAALLRNDSTDDGQSVQVRLIGRDSNRDAIGAVLRLQTSQGERLRMIKGGGTYMSQNDLRPLWGLPHAVSANKLSIRWPNGNEQMVEISSNGAVVIVEQ